MVRRRIALLSMVAVCMLFGCSGVKKKDGGVYFDRLEMASDETLSLSDSELDWPTADLIEVCLSESYNSVFNSILFYRNVYQINTKTGETVSHALEQDVTDDWGRNFRIPKDAFYDAWREFNGLQELETRPDAASCLLARYRNWRLPNADSGGPALRGGLLQPTHGSGAHDSLRDVGGHLRR